LDYYIKFWSMLLLFESCLISECIIRHISLKRSFGWNHTASYSMLLYQYFAKLRLEQFDVSLAFSKKKSFVSVSIRIFLLFLINFLYDFYQLNRFTYKFFRMSAIVYNFVKTDNKDWSTITLHIECKIRCWYLKI